MPYPNMPEDTWAEMDRCVERVMGEGKDKESAIAICHTSIMGKSADGTLLESAIKIGARNSRMDAQRLQMIHDYAIENGAVCNPDRTKAMNEDMLIAFGSEVKALGDGKIGGYLIRFTTPDDPDLIEEYFDATTDFGFKGSISTPLWFHHRISLKATVNGKPREILIKDQIGDGMLTLNEQGVYIEAILKARADYERIIRCTLKVLGWSSGTAPHLVDREVVGKAQHITRWPLGQDASVTPTPAEYRNQVVSLKSFTHAPLDFADEPETEQENGSATSEIKAAAIHPSAPQGEDTMSEELLTALKAGIDGLTTKVGALDALSAKVDNLETIIKTAPALDSGLRAGVTVTRDPADVPFGSLAEQCAAVKSAAVSQGRTFHPRLMNPAIKATGASEGIPADGGFLLEPTLTTEVLKPVHEVGPFSSMARKLPVSGNSNYGRIHGIDETSRATGSRWGGIRGYRLAEGGTKTASAPKFRQINWELKKFAVLVYATDERLMDASQFSEVVRTGAGEELAFMVNDDILNGDGAGGPFGILSSGCLVSQAAETNQTAATIVYENIVKMWSRLLPRSKAKSAWFVGSDSMPQLDTLALAAGTAALPPRFVDYDSTGVLRVKGRPVYETEFSAALGTVGDILLADMSQYLLWEKGTVQEAQSIHVQFLTDETVFRFVYRCDGQPSLASALTPYKGTGATLSPFVALATRS